MRVATRMSQMTVMTTMMTTDSMFNREFEAFLLKQVRREKAVYTGIMITFGCCAIACIVMAIAALIIYRIESVGIVIKLLLLFLGFAGICFANRYVTRSGSEAAEEMAYGLEHPECNIPDDYSDETKDARREACRKIHSIRGLIISYGIIAMMLWAVMVLMALLGGIGTPDFSLMFLLIAFVMLAMALPLSILTVAYILDLPTARRYRQLVDSVLNDLPKPTTT